MKSPFKSGDQVLWTYWHTIGPVQGTYITKRGLFIGLRRHTYRHWQKFGAKQMAGVLFEGNSRMSFVPVEELKPTTVTSSSRRQERQ